jgi:hypothetical protein
MAKYGTGKIYGNGWLYGPDPQYLLNVGNVPSAEAWGMPLVNPGPVVIDGAGNIPGAEALGTPWIFRIPKKFAVGLSARRLKVTLDG